MAAKTLDQNLPEGLFPTCRVHPNASVWRYLSRDKLDLFLQQEGALWFSRVDCFDDIFEGSISDAYSHMSYGPDVTPEKLQEMTRGAEWNKQWTVVNCWACAEEENALMWAAYGRDGVALKSTFGRLAAVLPSNSRIGPVQYIDFAQQHVPVGMEVWHKRHYFINECEVRACIKDGPPAADGGPDLTKSNPAKGRLVTAHPNAYLSAIVCRPYAGPDELARVQLRCAQAGISVPVRPSTMSGDSKWV